MIFKEKEYKYFILYILMGIDGKHGIGTYQVTLKKPITDIFDLQKIENSIKEKHLYSNVVVIGWKKF